MWLHPFTFKDFEALFRDNQRREHENDLTWSLFLSTVLEKTKWRFGRAISTDCI
jgi:hypothetical protein